MGGRRWDTRKGRRSFIVKQTKMVTINNQELKKAFSDSTKTQLLEQPNQVDNRVVIPIVDVTPYFHKKADIVRNGTLSAATSATIYTTPAERDFYLTSFAFSYKKDATSPAVLMGLSIVNVDGVRVGWNISDNSVTATRDKMQMNFSIPIKVARNSTITLTSSSATAVIVMDGTITGFVDEVM